jgi:GNAT superfamily N-acetyltransferase
MISNFVIQHVSELPTDIVDALVPSSNREGFEPINWLQKDWRSGKNKFAKPGEALYVARSDDRLVGVCGVNRDPYTKSDSICRLRRLYVLPQFRRMGVGRLLVERAFEDARIHFTGIRLRTFDEQAAAFFEALGFREVKDQGVATHEKRLDSVGENNV